MFDIITSAISDVFSSIDDLGGILLVGFIILVFAKSGKGGNGKSNKGGNSSSSNNAQ